MKIWTYITVFALAIAIAFLVGCPSSQIHQAAKAAATIADSAQAAEKQVEDLYHAGQISADESRAIVLGIRDVTFANDELVAQIRVQQQTGKYDAQAIIACFDQVAASVDKLNTEGVLHVKNPDAQNTVSLAISAIRTAVKAFAALLPPSQAAGTSSAWRYEPRGQVMAAGFDPTTAISLAMALLGNVLGLIGKLKEQGGMTDEQLLAEAEKVDQATRDQIAAFLATLPKSAPPAISEAPQPKAAGIGDPPMGGGSSA